MDLKEGHNSDIYTRQQRKVSSLCATCSFLAGLLTSLCLFSRTKIKNTTKLRVFFGLIAITYTHMTFLEMDWGRRLKLCFCVILYRWYYNQIILYLSADIVSLFICLPTVNNSRPLENSNLIWFSNFLDLFLALFSCSRHFIAKSRHNFLFIIFILFLIIVYCNLCELPYFFIN